MLLAQHQSWRRSRDVLRQALQLLITHWRSVAWLWFWQVALFIVYGFVSVALPDSTAQRFLSGFVGAIMLVYQLGMSACLVYLASDRKPRPLRAIARGSVFMKLPALVALALLVSVATVVATFAFIIPGLVLYIFWSLSIFILLVEDTSVRFALQRSVELVRGWWWPLLSRFLFLFTLLTLQTAVGYVPVVGNVVYALISLVLVPVSIWYGYLTYQEMVDIKQFKHLQAAHVSIGGKFLLACWTFLVFTLFVFVSAGVTFVEESVLSAPNLLPSKEEPWFFFNSKATEPQSILAPAVK